MKTLLFLTLALLSFSTTTLAITPRAKKMKAFRSERELKRYFHKIAERQKRARKPQVAEGAGAMTETVTVTNLPINRPGLPGYTHLFQSSAGIVFLRNDGLNLRRLGDLIAKPERAADDQCRASCVDWYGNARPLFIRGRIFALLGYELVEGKFEVDQMVELGRTSFAPQVTQP